MKKPRKKKTNHSPRVSPETSEPTRGHEARWEGSMNAHHSGMLLGAALRGMASGTARAATDFLLNQLTSGD